MICSWLWVGGRDEVANLCCSKANCLWSLRNCEWFSPTWWGSPLLSEMGAGQVWSPLLQGRRSRGQGGRWENPLFLWSADLIGIQCLSLHKSLYWYIIFFSTQGGGPWRCVVWGRLWGTFLFRWGAHDSKSCRGNLFVRLLSRSWFRTSQELLKVCYWICCWKLANLLLGYPKANHKGVMRSICILTLSILNRWSDINDSDESRIWVSECHPYMCLL